MTSEIDVKMLEDGRIAVVQINRPHRRNACNFEAWTDMRDIFLGFASNKKIRLVILSGAGGHFCAGDDITAFRAVLDDKDKADTYRARIQECYASIQDLEVPVIAAISGVCVGGGCSLALCCDFRVADASARIGVPVAKLGLVYPTIQLIRLSHLIGIGKTRRWLYTGELVDCKSAFEAGFLDEMCENDVVNAALAFGASMIDAAPLSISGSKLQLNAISTDSVDSYKDEIETIIDRSNNSQDYKNAAVAFAQKRQPQFIGE